MAPSPSRTLLERRWILFLLIALVFRGLFTILLIGGSLQPAGGGRLAVEITDTGSYLDPIENMMAGGAYAPDYRMPGVGAPYWVFRQFFDVGAARDAMVIMQWLLSGLAVYLLARLAQWLSGSTRVALVTYGLFLFSTSTSVFDPVLTSDSLAPSVIVIQAFVLHLAFERKSRLLLLLAGLLLTWMYFIRPVASLLVLPAAFFVLMRWNGRPSLRPLIWLLFPVVVIETAWVIRNWKANHEFNPLTNQGMMPDAISERTRGHVMDFVRAYGGNYIWWEPGADIRWFGEWAGEAAVDDEGRNAPGPPPDAYVPGYDRDSLLEISGWIREIHTGRLSPQDSIAATERVNTKLDRYARMHAAGAPLSHYIVSRCRMLRYLLLQSGCEMLFSKPFDQLPWWKQTFKVAQVALYAFVIIAGGIFSIISIWRWKRARSILALWVPIVAVYMIAVYPLILKMAEHRWVAHVFPLWLLMAVVGVAPFFGRIGSARSRRTTQP